MPEDARATQAAMEGKDACSMRLEHALSQTAAPSISDTRQAGPRSGRIQA